MNNEMLERPVYAGWRLYKRVKMSNKLKTALEKREYFDLRLPKDM